MKNKRSILSCIVLLTLISMGSGTLISGRPAREQLQVMHLKFTPATGGAIKACVIEGGMVKITNHRTGTVFAYQPTVMDESRGSVLVKVYQVTGPESDEQLTEMETLDISFKGGKSTVKTPVYNIEVETLGKTASPDKSQSNPTTENNGGGSQCCVTCGDITTCSNCTVTMSCGSCCTGKPNAPACACNP